MRAEFRAVREVVMRVRESLSGVMWNWLVVSEMSWGVLVKVFLWFGEWVRGWDVLLRGLRRRGPCWVVVGCVCGILFACDGW